MANDKKTKQSAVTKNVKQTAKAPATAEITAHDFVMAIKSNASDLQLKQLATLSKLSKLSQKEIFESMSISDYNALMESLKQMDNNAYDYHALLNQIITWYTYPANVVTSKNKPSFSLKESK